MVVHKTIADAKKNLEESIPYIGGRYESAVKKADWATAAASDAAEENYAAGVAEAAAKKTRQKKIKLVSNSDWQNAAATKVAPIIGERIRQALVKYEANMGPVLDAMNAAADAAPARTADWRANINNRLIPVVTAARRAAGKE